MSSPRIFLFLLLVLPLAGSGCAQKLTYDRFNAISTGDSPEAVRAILGEPWMKSSQAWVYQDVDRGINAMVYFQDCQVVRKQWGDARHGIQGEPGTCCPGESGQTTIRQIK